MRSISGVIATLLLLAAFTGCDNNEEAFPDAAFKACVEKRLKDYSGFDGKDYKIENDNDLEVIKILACGGGGISSIKGSERLLNVQTLALNQNQIESVEPLRHLKKLELLNIATNKIVDLEPLAEASSLRNINIMGNYVKDILPLSPLKNLRDLYVKNNCIVDASQFDTLRTAIPELSIWDEDIQDPSRCQ